MIRAGGPFRLAACLSALTVSLAQAQATRWSLVPEARLGVFLPATRLGTIDVTSARMRASPTVGLGVRLRPPNGPVSLRLSTQQALRSGMTFRSTEGCLNNCGNFREDHGRFWAVGADLLLTVTPGRWALELGLGPGMRGYHVAGLDMTGPAPPGTSSPDPFLKNQVAAALHGGAELGRGLGRALLSLGIEDYLSRGPAHGTQHDLVISLGVSLPRKR